MLPQEISYSRIKAEEVAPALRLKARDAMARCMDLANERLHTRFLMPSCSFDLRGKAAAQTWVEKNHIRLNPTLYVQDTERFVREVIPQQIAFLLARQTDPKASVRSESWMRVMRALGFRDVAPKEAPSAAAYRYRCGCKEFEVTQRRHERLQSGAVQLCPSCRTAWRFTGKARLAGVWQDLDARSSVPWPQQPPSEKMVRYMQSLAAKLSWTVPRQAYRTNAAATHFVETAKLRVSPGMFLEQQPPTVKQLRYAQSLAEQRQVQIPEGVRQSRKALSEWIAQARNPSQKAPS